MDLVFAGGNILTMDAYNTQAQAIAIDQGRIAAIGANEELSALISPATTVVNLVGRTVIPGLSRSPQSL